MTTATIEAPKRTAQIKRMPASQIRQTEHARRSWHVTIPVDHDADDCLRPEYLWMRHDLLRVGDHVELLQAEFKFYIELLIIKIDVETQCVHTRCVNARDFSDDEMPVADLSGAIIEHIEADGWRVVLGTSVLSKNHKNKRDAESWLSKRRVSAMGEGG
jgi:hypothetical protein